MGLVTKRLPIYTADNTGRFRSYRRVVGWLLVAFFVITPWIQIGGLPAVRIDIPGRRLLLVGTLFTPHDTWALALLLLCAAVGLFAFTALLGRIWCGWACPQTVWLEWVYRPLERWIEGPSHRRRKRDAGPHNSKWWAIKSAKVGAFAAVSALTTAIFLAWFVGGPELLRGEIGGVGFAIGGTLFAFFFLDAVWFREQLCHYACPYARFQGVLMDRRSLIVAYDVDRGEPRGKARDPSTGDCVDCNRCVQVCPSGIDIRDGDQLQCIACAGCVDACDAVMVKLGKPTGLIRYTTQRDAPAAAGEARPVFSRRVAVYAAILSILASGLGFGLVTRPEVVVSIARVASGEIYRELPEGRVLNQFTLHVTNRSTQPHSFEVKSTTPGAEVVVPGSPWNIQWGAEERMQGFVSVPRASFEAGRFPVEVVAVRDDGREAAARLVMLGPEGEASAALLLRPAAAP